MKTFKKLAACAVIAPMTMGAASVYALADTPERTQEPHTQEREHHETQRPTEERHGQQEQRRQQEQQRGQAQRRQDAQRRGEEDRGYQAGQQHRDRMDGEQLTRKPANGFHAESLIGQDIRSRNDDEEIGSIQDLVIDQDGQVKAVIVGVGGILGMGERDVAISWDSIQHTRGEDGEQRLTTTKTKSELENAPEYDRDADDDDNGNGVW